MTWSRKIQQEFQRSVFVPQSTIHDYKLANYSMFTSNELMNYQFSGSHNVIQERTPEYFHLIVLIGYSCNPTRVPNNWIPQFTIRQTMPRMAVCIWGIDMRIPSHLSRLPFKLLRFQFNLLMLIRVLLAIPCFIAVALYWQQLSYTTRLWIITSRMHLVTFPMVVVLIVG